MRADGEQDRLKRDENRVEPLSFQGSRVAGIEDVTFGEPANGPAFWDDWINAEESVPEASVMGADVANPHVGLEPRLQHLVREIEFSRNFLAIPEGQVGVKMMKLAGGEQLDDQPGFGLERDCVGGESIVSDVSEVSGGTIPVRDGESAFNVAPNELVLVGCWFVVTLTWRIHPPIVGCW